MKILISTPLHSNIMDSRHVGNVVDTMFDLAKNGFEVAWDRPSSVALSYNRNISVWKAMQEKYDYLLFWDSDTLVTDPTFLRTMIQKDEQVIALPVRLKVPELNWNFKNAHNSNDPDMQEVTHIGTALMLIRDDVWEEILPPWFVEVDTFSDNGPNITYEDFNFCKKLVDHEISIYMMSGFTTIHIGTHDYEGKL